VLAADLGGALPAGGYLSAALELELSGVVSPQTLLLHLDVTLHPISREVDLRSCPVEGVHPICHLAELSIEEEHQFVCAIKEGGGLSMAQCHHLITKLKERRREEKRREKKEIAELERLYAGSS
jgi:hypothetical protein